MTVPLMAARDRSHSASAHMVRRRTIICADSRGFAKDGNTSGCACGVGQGSGEVLGEAKGHGRTRRGEMGWDGMGRDE